MKLLEELIDYQVSTVLAVRTKSRYKGLFMSSEFLKKAMHFRFGVSLSNPYLLAFLSPKKES